MNKGFRTLGIVGAIMVLVGGIFKMEHFPGGGVLVVFGSTILLIYLLMWFDFIRRNISDKKQMYAYASLFSVLLFACLASLFKIQHYPGAGYLIFIHLALLIVVFIPLYTIYFKSLTDVNRKTHAIAFFVLYISVSGLLLIKGTSSVDVLNSIAVIDKNIEQNIKTLEISNDMVYASIKDSIEVKKAEKIKVLSNSFYQYLADIKSELISKSEGIDKKIADTISVMNLKYKDNYDMPTNYFIGNSVDGSKGKSRELKNKINEYKAELHNILDKDSTEIRIGLNTNNRIDKIEGNVNWEMSNFYHQILISDMAILSQLQSEVRYAESAALNIILQKK